MRGGERHGSAIWLRHVKEHLTTRWTHQCSQHRFGRVAVICDQRADFPTRAARSNNSPGNQPVLTDQGTPTWPGAAIQARRNAGLAAGNTVASSRAIKSKDTSVSDTVFGAASARGGAKPP